jgi:FKBP-type peptidyl-prolyl cis-trans isomerase FkpA
MMKVRSIYPLLILISGLFIITSCNESTVVEDDRDQEARYFNIYVGANYPGAVPEASGLYYIENKAGTGAMTTDSSWVLVNHVSYMIPSNQVYETYIESVALDNRIEDANALYGPFKMQNGTMNEGFTEGLNKMKEGGEATFMFTSELGYGSKSRGAVPAYSSLKYEVVLLEVLGDDIDAYEAAKILAYVDTIAGADTVYDAIDDLSLYYVIDEPTDGAPVAIDSTIQVAYKGYLTDGRVFDESADSAYFEFKVGDYDVESTAIVGWHLGLAKFREGEKGRLIIPYQLGYGASGKFTSKNNVAIPPYETLVFDVEIISVYQDDNDEKPDPEE